MRLDCHFSRSVSLDYGQETESPRSLQRKNVKQKYEMLEYDFKLDYVPEGGKIKIKIEPMHKIKDLVARYDTLYIKFTQVFLNDEKTVIGFKNARSVLVISKYSQFTLSQKLVPVLTVDWMFSYFKQVIQSICLTKLSDFKMDHQENE